MKVSITKNQFAIKLTQEKLTYASETMFSDVIIYSGGKL